MSPMVGADQPLGARRTTSYQMVTHRYTGRALYVMFRTAADLSQWLPSPLQAVDPHRGFIKVYRLKRRPVDGHPLPSAYSGYAEVCITTLVTIPGDPVPRHYNLAMWLDRDWAIYKYREVFGWPKKLADIDISLTFASSDSYDHDTGTSAYHARAHRHGYPLLDISADLGTGEPCELPPFNGFYSTRFIASPDGDPERSISELLAIDPIEGWSTTPRFGTASVSLGAAPDEEVDLFGPLTVEGCALFDTGWVLPAWPARRLATLGDIQADMGEPSPWLG